MFGLRRKVAPERSSNAQRVDEARGVVVHEARKPVSSEQWRLEPAAARARLDRVLGGAHRAHVCVRSIARPREAHPGEFALSAWRPWKVLHVHLDAAIEPPQLEEGVGGVLAVFWHSDIPVGQRRFIPEELPVSAAALRESGIREAAVTVLHEIPIHEPRKPVARAEPEASCSRRRLTEPASPVRLLARLAAARDAEAAAANRLAASVVICTRDRPAALARCLESITGMLGPLDELVVVDNAPSSTASREVVQRFPAVRYVLETRPGLDVARNAGLREARRELIVFCDDDIEVHPAWLTRMKAPFADAGIAAVTGLVLPASLETEAECLFEFHWGFNRGCRTRDFGPRYFESRRAKGVPVWEIGAGASMAFRRDVVRELGGFDERLDVGAAGCSGDSEMWYRLLAAGYLCRYDPAAVAYHHHRKEMDALRHQVWSYMRGHAAALLVQFERHRHYGNLRRLLISRPRYDLGRWVKRGTGRDRWRSQTLSDEVRGWLAGIAYYLKVPRPEAPAVDSGASEIALDSGEETPGTR